MSAKLTILGIESSCDDTSAAVLRDGWLLSNVMASQEVHRQYGGVIPELASRAHQQNILPVVSEALRQAGVTMDEVDAIAFTRGPGLLGSLLVGTSFAKGLSVSTGKPQYPFLCLLVSGGHTQIVRVDAPLEFTILGGTIDDAVGEAFDKCAKVLGLGYPGGPAIDRLARGGNPRAFRFAKPNIPGLDYSFSGIKTSLLYFLRDRLKEDPSFIENNIADICASFQQDLIDILLKKLIIAARETGIREIALAGGVSANGGLRERITTEGRNRGWNTYLPALRFTTDNAAMIAVTGWFKYMRGELTPLDVAPVSRAAEYLADERV